MGTINQGPKNPLCFSQNWVEVSTWWALQSLCMNILVSFWTIYKAPLCLPFNLKISFIRKSEILTFTLTPSCHCANKALVKTANKRMTHKWRIGGSHCWGAISVTSLTWDYWVNKIFCIISLVKSRFNNQRTAVSQCVKLPCALGPVFLQIFVQETGLSFQMNWLWHHISGYHDNSTQIIDG